jgi:16S rRNA (cytidine1402-2'-O)-methyltransferase
MPLYVVSTPIGNLEDISARALKVLSQVQVVACEDTRHTGRLLAHFGLRKELARYDEHVHRRQAPKLLERLKQGQDVALVTDAGTPGVSDPGAGLIREAVAAGVRVIPVPGASALLAALAGSGLPMDRFTFLGFLPRRPGRVVRELENAGRDRTVVFLESPFRLADTLSLALKVFGDVPAAVGREMTKLHEEFIRGRLSQVLDAVSQRKELKGEATIVIAPQALEAAADSNDAATE